MIKKNPSGIKALSNDINNFMLRVAKDMSNEAKRVVPVDTGRLRASIDVEEQRSDDPIASKAFLIGSDVEYANFVEEGTKFQQAQPYLRPTAEQLPRFVNKNRKRS